MSYFSKSNEQSKTPLLFYEAGYGYGHISDISIDEAVYMCLGNVTEEERAEHNLKKEQRRLELDSEPILTHKTYFEQVQRVRYEKLQIEQHHDQEIFQDENKRIITDFKTELIQMTKLQVQTLLAKHERYLYTKLTQENIYLWNECKINYFQEKLDELEKLEKLENHKNQKEKEQQKYQQKLHEIIPLPKDFKGICPPLDSPLDYPIKTLEQEEEQIRHSYNKLLIENCACCSESTVVIRCLTLIEDMKYLPYCWEKPTKEESKDAYERHFKEWTDQKENHREQKHHMIQSHIKNCLFC
jgi:hypothetical protein